MATSLFHTHQPQWDSAPISPSADSTPLRNVAFSVAEAALRSTDPNSPSHFGLMDAPAIADLNDDDYWDDCIMGTWPRTKGRRAESLAERGTGRPLWDLVEQAKERRERENSFPFDFAHPANSAKCAQAGEFGLAPSFMTKSADTSPDSAFFKLEQLERALPRLSARDFAAQAEKHATTTAHARTQSEAHSPSQSPSQRTRSQANAAYRPNTRLPSLAQIQAKMNRMGSVACRSDSMDSQDSDGPQTPTDESMSFEFNPSTPDSPSSRLAPFLRERTHGRLARPNSMPPVFDNEDVENVYPAHSFRMRYQGSLPPTPQSKRRTWCQTSVPSSPGTPSRSRVSRLVTPPKNVPNCTPTSPTDSITSVASLTSVSSNTLPIITCTPAAEQDSDDESEGDVIVFSGDADEDNDDGERRVREQAGLDMVHRLQRRGSLTSMTA